MSNWKKVSLVKTGLSHLSSHTVCQDNIAIAETDSILVAALADGIGSLRHSEFASRAATDAVCAFCTAHQSEIVSGAVPSPEAIILSVQKAIEAKAGEKMLSCSEMDCTLSFVCISKADNRAMIGLLGDNAVCVMSQKNPVVMNDGSKSANGTYAVLDKDASAHLLIQSIDLDQHGVLGFILTSDGLENELYMKGSARIQKIAASYFNTLTEGGDAEKAISDRIGQITAIPDSPFDDDISLIILSRAETNMELPSDPTWLCSCGKRNPLQNTYCQACNKDFTVLYGKYRFKEYGGKAAFFAKVNAMPDKEREIVGLPPVAPATAAGQNETATVTPAAEQNKAAPVTPAAEQNKAATVTPAAEQSKAAPVTPAAEQNKAERRDPATVFPGSASPFSSAATAFHNSESTHAPADTGLFVNKPATAPEKSGKRTADPAAQGDTAGTGGQKAGSHEPSQKRTEAQKTVPIKEEEAQKRTGPIKIGRGRGEKRRADFILTIVCFLLLLLCLIVFFVGRLSAKKAARDLSADYEMQLNQQRADYETQIDQQKTDFETQIDQQKTDYETQIDQLEERIDALEEELKTPAAPQAPVVVLRSPTPERKPVGYANAAGSWLFGFTVEGPAIAFKWEKQQEDGTWVSLVFDQEGTDARYGIKLEQSLQNGSSKLVAAGLTEESAGTYKCTVETDHGYESVEVTLTIENAAQGTASSPSSVEGLLSSSDSSADPASEKPERHFKARQNTAGSRE